MLLVRNDYDPITHYMSEWSIPVMEVAEKKGVKVDLLDGKLVSRSQIRSRIEKLDRCKRIRNSYQLTQ